MTSAPAIDYPTHRHQLDNGLRVVISPDASAPVVAVNLWYDVGSRDESVGQTGFAHLFEHLMFQGSAHVASGEHLGALQAAGASCNATTSFDRTNYFATAPVGVFELALWLEADRMGSLTAALDQGNLDNQREVVKEEKRQRYDNVPYGDVMEHLLQLTFPADHPYAHTVIGSMADLDAATTGDVAAFFDAYYSPSNAVLTVVGDVEPEAARARIERYFGTIPARPRPPRTTPDALPPLAGVPSRTLTREVPASTWYATWRLPAEGTRAYDACTLALSILGGSQTSRLHRRLVLGDQSATAAGASTMGLVGGTSLGIAYARSLEDNPLDALRVAVLEEWTRLADEGPTDDELARERVQFEREWLQHLADFEGRADVLSSFELHRGGADRLNRRLAEVCSITADEVRDALRTHLAPAARADLFYCKGIPA